MQDGINNNVIYVFNSNTESKNSMYYSNSNAKKQLETWYTENIVNKGYSDDIATGEYFCEQSKTAYNSAYATGSGANMTVYSSYTPNFKCETDANGKGLVNASVGLLTYDEVVHAGSYYHKVNENYYLYNVGTYTWTMSSGGFSGAAFVWYLCSTGDICDYMYVNGTYHMRAIINLKADTKVSGEGSSESHWVVQ